MREGRAWKAPLNTGDFVGLIVPHFARAITGMHLPWEQHFLHLNAVLVIVGAPVVILLLLFSPTMRGQR